MAWGFPNPFNPSLMIRYALYFFIAVVALTSCSKEEVCTAQIELGHTYAYGVADYTFIDYNSVQITNANGAVINRSYNLTDGILSVSGGGGQMRFQFNDCAWTASNGTFLQY